MKYARAALLLIIAFAAPIAAQNEQPDHVYQLNNTTFAYYKGRDTTQVLAGGILIFDNSRRGFQYVHGAQRVELYFDYEFKGRTLKEEVSYFTMVFESRSSVPRLTTQADRTFQLVADGEAVSSASPPLLKSTPIGLVTWEQVSVQIPMSDFRKFLKANESVGVKLGDIYHTFTMDEYKTLMNFVLALKQAEGIGKQ